jgi:hypothetical protein
MFKITAQSFTTTQRIAKTIAAPSEAAALRLVAPDLENAGFYVVDIREVTTP